MSNRSITGYHLNTFTIRISRHFLSTREFQMGNFQKYWSQNVGQDFIVLDFFVGGISCGRLISPAHETQSMREIRLLRWTLPRKGGGLTGMHLKMDIKEFIKVLHLKPDQHQSLLSQKCWLTSYTDAHIWSLIGSFITTQLKVKIITAFQCFMFIRLKHSFYIVITYSICI